MRLEEDQRGVSRQTQQEILESVFVEMDPVLHGFAGVLVELIRVGEGFAVLETAAGSGDRLLEFHTRSRQLAYAFFEAEVRPAPGWGTQLDGEAVSR
jgi:hypothetical protein